MRTEVAGTLYRTQNAQFDKATGEWSLNNSSLPAYAIAVDPSGTTSFLTVPAGSASFTVWGTNGGLTLPATVDASALGVYNVMSYGATGNGSTDDTTAINNALAAAVNAGGGIVYYPPGTYAVSEIAGLTGKENVSIFHVGSGRDVTVILGSKATTNVNVLYLTSQGGVSGITINGDGKVLSALAIGNTNLGSSTLAATFTPPAVGSPGSFTVASGSIFAVGQQVQVGTTGTPYLGEITGVSGTTITATTLAQGSSGSWPTGTTAHPGNPIAFAIIRDVRCTNIGSSPSILTWLLYSLCFPTGALFLISQLYLDNVLIDGPSSAYQDAMGIANVDQCFANNMEFRNLQRTPNFYFINVLTATNIRVTGGISSSSHCFVIDSHVNHAFVNGLVVDSTNADPPIFNGLDCTIVNSLFQAQYVAIGTAGFAFPSIALRFVGCEILSEIVINGTTGAPQLLELLDCRIAPQFSAQDCVLNNETTSATIENYSFRNCVFDTTNTTGPVLGSNLSATMSNCQLINNVVLGGRGLIYAPTITVGSGNTIRGNTQGNPGPVSTPSVGTSPWTYTNNTGYDCTMYVSGGTVSSVAVGAVTTHLTAGSFHLPIGQSIKITYSAAPTIALVGE